MNRLGSLTLALAAGLAVSCGGGPKEAASADLWHVPLDLTKIGSGETPKMSDMVDRIEYVALEAIPGTPIGGISSSFLTDKHIFFFEHNTGIMQFTRDGRFVRRIGSVGRGPGEFTGRVDIHVDEKNGVVYTIPDWLNIVGRYELATGKFIGETAITEADGTPAKGYHKRSYLSLPDATGSFTRGVMSVSQNFEDMKSGKVAVCSFAVLDLPSARIIHREKSRLRDDIPPEQSAGATSTLWYDPEGRANLFEKLADTVYVINNDFSLTPRMVVDFGMMKPASLGIEEPGVSILSVTEGVRHMILMTAAAAEIKMVYYDKVTGESSSSWPFSGGQPFISTGAVNDIDGGFAHLVPVDKNLCVASYDAFDMVEKLTPGHFERVRASVKFPDRLEKLQALVATLKEDDNPVIAIAHLKAATAAADSATQN